jgi:flagellar biosynthesis protein
MPDRTAALRYTGTGAPRVVAAGRGHEVPEELWAAVAEALAWAYAVAEKAITPNR